MKSKLTNAEQLVGELNRRERNTEITGVVIRIPARFDIGGNVIGNYLVHKGTVVLICPEEYAMPMQELNRLQVFVAKEGKLISDESHQKVTELVVDLLIRYKLEPKNVYWNYEANCSYINLAWLDEISAAYAAAKSRKKGAKS